MLTFFVVVLLIDLQVILPVAVIGVALGLVLYKFNKSENESSEKKQQEEEDKRKSVGGTTRT